MGHKFDRFFMLCAIGTLGALIGAIDLRAGGLAEAKWGAQSTLPWGVAAQPSGIYRQPTPVGPEKPLPEWWHEPLPKGVVGREKDPARETWAQRRWEWALAEKPEEPVTPTLEEWKMLGMSERDLFQEAAPAEHLRIRFAEPLVREGESTDIGLAKLMTGISAVENACFSLRRLLPNPNDSFPLIEVCAQLDPLYDTYDNLLELVGKRESRLYQLMGPHGYTTESTAREYWYYRELIWRETSRITDLLLCAAKAIEMATLHTYNKMILPFAQNYLEATLAISHDHAARLSKVVYNTASDEDYLQLEQRTPYAQMPIMPGILGEAKQIRQLVTDPTNKQYTHQIRQGVRDLEDLYVCLFKLAHAAGSNESDAIRGTADGSLAFLEVAEFQLKAAKHKFEMSKRNAADNRMLADALKSASAMVNGSLDGLLAMGTQIAHDITRRYTVGQEPVSDPQIPTPEEWEILGTGVPAEKDKFDRPSRNDPWDNFLGITPPDRPEYDPREESAPFGGRSGGLGKVLEGQGLLAAWEREIEKEGARQDRPGELPAWLP